MGTDDEASLLYTWWGIANLVSRIALGYLGDIVTPAARFRIWIGSILGKKLAGRRENIFSYLDKAQ